MLRFIHHKRFINPRTELLRLLTYNDIQDYYTLLIKTGEIETAFSDYLNKDFDTFDKVTSTLRHITIYASTKNLSQLKDSIKSIIHYIPDIEVEVSIPEGFAYYGLYPEQYKLTAFEYASKNKDKTIVIGLRNIGSALSAVVASELLNYLDEVDTFTLRPRGEWNNREPLISKKINKYLKNNKNNNFIIVDEGPGITGTSISGTIKLLMETGIKPSHIFVFPSYLPDLSKFNDVWGKVNLMVEHFDRKTMLGRYNSIEEIKGNNFIDKPKYKITRDSNKYFVKFVGLGEYGKVAFERANEFYLQGFSPKPLKLEKGFIYFNFIDNFLTQEDISKEVLEFASSYYSYIYINRKAIPTHSDEELKEIAGVYDIEISDRQAVEIDGAPEISSFAYVEGKYIKTGNSNYPLRHIFPGNIDIHYDIAGFIIKNDLNKEQSNYFVNKLTFQISQSKLEFFKRLIQKIH